MDTINWCDTTDWRGSLVERDDGRWLKTSEGFLALAPDEMEGWYCRTALQPDRIDLTGDAWCFDDIGWYERAMTGVSNAGV